MNTTLTSRPEDQGNAEQGFMLLGLIVAIALIMLWLTVAAPPVVRNLRRDREVEAVHRGNQYVRAVREYYIQFKHYPGSMEQLEKSNNIRFLRQRYVNPIDGKDDWRVIAVGTNKTTVKGFFGEPLTGLATTGIGSVAGMASSGISPAGGTSVGGAIGGGAVGAILGAISASGPTNTAAPGTAPATGTTGAPGTPGSTSTPGPAGSTSSGFGSPASAGISGGSAPFMGIGLNATGDSIIAVNEQTSYDTWEFLYDPRIELLKQKATMNGGAGSIGAGSLGQTPGAIGTPGAPNPTTPPNL